MNGIRLRNHLAAEYAGLYVCCLLTVITVGHSYGAAASPALPTVTVVATGPTAAVGGSPTGLLTFARSSVGAGALIVKFALEGSAVKWTDYYRLPEGDMPVSVTIPAGARSATLIITAKGNSTKANPETAIFTLSADPAYLVGAAKAATIKIMAPAAVTGPPSANKAPTPPATVATPATSVAPKAPAAPVKSAAPAVSTTPATVAAPATSVAPKAPVASAESAAPAVSTTSATIPNQSTGIPAAESEMDYTNLIAPLVGDNALRILTPTLLELRQINTKAPDPAEVGTWNLVNSSGVFTAPDVSEFVVTVSGQKVEVTSVGFRRRVSFAPLASYDLRIDNALYLEVAEPIADNSTVAVTNPSETVFPSSVAFSAVSNPLRYSPAIHVNQEGYVPSFPKKAIVGYYLGDLGEMPVTATSFSVIDVNTNAVVYQSALTLRRDLGYNTSPPPYQLVYVADFSGLTTPGEYQVQVEGMGVSLPFLINEGIAMGWVRAYALGMYEQRSGAPGIGLPWTRFAHAADHTAPASVPAPDTSPAFAFTWNCIKSYTSQVTPSGPPLQFPQTAPALTSNETSLYPFVNTGTVDVSGGHWDAGDYSKYTENSAQLVHELIFAVDNIPGLSTLDNFGIPESGLPGKDAGLRRRLLLPSLSYQRGI
jgi:hypothetical protein